MAKRVQVTITVELRGDLRASKEHIIHNLENFFDKPLVFSSEFYGDKGDDYEEWEMYFEKPTVEVKELVYELVEYPFCEHCGNHYADLGYEIQKDGTTYCLDCYNTSIPLTEQLYETLSSKLEEYKVEYYSSKLKKAKAEVGRKKKKK